MIVILTLLTATSVFAFKPITWAAFKAHPIPKFAMRLEGEDLVDYINTVQPFFQANFTVLSKEKERARIMSAQFMVAPKERAGEIVLAEEVPRSFDARERWPECKSIGMIRDQSACGSCWAVSAASAMSDRLCIQSNGKSKKILSDADIISCCKECGYGCQGGWPIEAWRYVVNRGVCTGGLYGEKNVCKPYPFYPCGHHDGQKYYGPCPQGLHETPKCKKQCQRGYEKNYEEDKFFGKSAYAVKDTEAAIQKEIMTNGPVQAVMRTYQDFSYYKGGIYMHTAGAQTGATSVKLIGWGEESGVPYWIAANTWNSDWGENGFFRILRGSNECGVESMVIAGMMKV